MNNLEVGKSIRLFRQQKGISQKELADKLGIFQQAVYQYETGRRKPKYEMVKRIADALGISVDELILKNKEEK